MIDTHWSTVFMSQQFEMLVYSKDRQNDPYDLMVKRINAYGFDSEAPGVLALNIALQANIVVSGKGLLDTSKK